jgi:hypothetical protein
MGLVLLIAKDASDEILIGKAFLRAAAARAVVSPLQPVVARPVERDGSNG